MADGDGRLVQCKRRNYQCTAMAYEATAALQCSIDGIVNRSRALLDELRRHARALQLSGNDATSEHVAIATADIFFPAIETDVALPLATRVRMLQTVLGGPRAAGATSNAANVAQQSFAAHGQLAVKLACSMHGWIDTPHTIEEVAAQMPLDEAIGLEAVLTRRVYLARAALGGGGAERGAAVWRRAAPVPSAVSLGISADGYWTNGGEACLLAGYNALDHHLGLSMEQQANSGAQLRAGQKQLPRGWQARLATLGVNVISYEIPLMKLVTEDMRLNVAEARLISDHLDWAAQVIPHRLPLTS